MLPNFLGFCQKVTKMRPTSIKFLIVYSLLNLFVLSRCSEAEYFRNDLDHELDNAITLATPEFATSLKRRFTNVGVSKSILNRNSGRLPIKFDDLFIRDGENRIELKNIEIKEQPITRMNEIVPNLRERILKISADWYNIVLSGSFEMFNTSQIKLLPVVSTGEIVIIIENIVAEGLVGFNIEGEALRATNFDLTHIVKNVSIKVEYYHDSKKSRELNTIQNDDIDNTIAKHLKNDLFWTLEKSLRNNLDQVLLDYNLSEIFSDNFEIAEKYRTMEYITRKTFNVLVDALIKKLSAQQFLAGGYLNLPNLEESGFNAVDGQIGNLRTIYRTSDFSYTSNRTTHLSTIFGEVGLKDCQAFYNHWSYDMGITTLSGSIRINVGENSMRLKLIMNPSDMFKINLKFKKIEFKVVRLDDIDCDITGLGLLNWFASKIIGWVSSLFKTDILNLVTKYVNDALQVYVDPKTMLNGNGIRIK